MSDPQEPLLAPRYPVHPLNLIGCGGGWTAAPLCHGGRCGPGFTPFELPPPPRQRLDWLVVAGHRFWARHRRPMAALLLIDSRTQRWSIALPVQTCGREAARWSLSAARSPEQAATALVGGTFQVIAVQARPSDHVPPLSGLHFVLRSPDLSPGASPLSAFVRDGGGLHAADPGALLSDDCAAAIIAAQPRLRLA